VPIERRDGYRLWVGGPVPRGFAGITLWSLVIVRDPSAATPALLRHERVHVDQWRRHGAAVFVLRYVGSYLRWRSCGKDHLGAYRRIPFEIEAEWTARRAAYEAESDPGFAVRPDMSRR
jgi:hypothetical protein